MKRILQILMVVAVVVALAAPSEADTITLVGGTAGTIPSAAANDFIGPLFPGTIGGYFGSQLNVVLAAGSTVLFEFFGAEAGFHNELIVDGDELFDHPGGFIISANLGSPLATAGPFTVGPFSGLAPIRFDVNNDAASVVNGANPNDFGHAAVGPNFFASCNPFSAAPGPTTCNQVYLFLDDGGAGPDDDHDDFLTRLTITEAIPEPATLLLFGTGLVGAGVRKYRRKN